MDPTLSTRPPTDTGYAVSVLLPLPLIAPYDYLVPENMEWPPGSYVEAARARRGQGRWVRRGAMWTHKSCAKSAR